MIKMKYDLCWSLPFTDTSTSRVLHDLGLSEHRVRTKFIEPMDFPLVIRWLIVHTQIIMVGYIHNDIPIHPQ